MRRKKGKEIDLSLTKEKWEEIFEWLDTQPVIGKGVSYVSAARRFLPRFHIAEYKAGCSHWAIFQRTFSSKAQVRYQYGEWGEWGEWGGCNTTALASSCAVCSIHFVCYGAWKSEFKSGGKA